MSRGFRDLGFVLDSIKACLFRVNKGISNVILPPMDSCELIFFTSLFTPS